MAPTLSLLLLLSALAPAAARLGKHNQHRGLQANAPPCAVGEEPILGFCEVCRPGTFSDAVGNEACEACPPGQVQPDFGQTGCVDCPPGHFNFAEQQHSCQECAPGTFQPLPGQTSCIVCTDADCTTTRDGPSGIPTAAPTESPSTTSSPDVSTSAPTATLDSDTGDGGISGDPHIKKWDGTWYDYNGECDLVLLSSLELTIHVRTKIRYSYSFIEAAAIQIGYDILEVSSWGDFSVNGVTNAGATTSADGDSESLPSVGGHTVSHTRIDAKKHIFVVRLDEHHNVTVSTFKDFVNVELHIPGAGSQGLLGEFGTGKLLARDGKTVLEDVNAFGQEWQKTEQEPKLFRTDRAPQAPHEACRLPKVAASLKQENSVLKQAATKACEEHARQNKDACIADILATGDLELIESGNF